MSVAQETPVKFTETPAERDERFKLVARLRAVADELSARGDTPPPPVVEKRLFEEVKSIHGSLTSRLQAKKVAKESAPRSRRTHRRFVAPRARRAARRVSRLAAVASAGSGEDGPAPSEPARQSRNDHRCDCPSEVRS